MNAEVDTDADADTSVRLVHLGNGVPPVDIFVDGDGSAPAATLALPNPDDSYTTGTDYLTLQAGEEFVQVPLPESLDAESAER